MANTVPELMAAVRDYALALPGAYEEFPWGEAVVKVNKKIFAFLGVPNAEASEGSLGVKLPVSSGAALQFPYIKPSGYNLGKSGWVSIRITADQLPAQELLECWIEESYRAIAPKKLVAQFEAMQTAG